jgi:hypothetical protein
MGGRRRFFPNVRRGSHIVHSYGICWIDIYKDIPSSSSLLFSSHFLSFAVSSSSTFAFAVCIKSVQFENSLVLLIYPSRISIVCKVNKQLLPSYIPSTRAKILPPLFKFVRRLCSASRSSLLILYSIHSPRDTIHLLDLFINPKSLPRCFHSRSLQLS